MWMSVHWGEDLSFILVDKAREGSDILQRIQNAHKKGGIKLYAEVYQWFTETSGLGLVEQAARLMDPKAAGSEAVIPEATEVWSPRRTDWRGVANSMRCLRYTRKLPP